MSDLGSDADGVQLELGAKRLPKACLPTWQHVFTLSSTPSKRWNLDGANEVSADAQFSSASRDLVRPNRPGRMPQILRH